MSNVAPIIKKKKVVKADGHHGGAWKVAYADFVTAMMAFFLLMWLLNATSEDQKKGLADFFDPSIPISRLSAGGSGMLSGDDQFVEEQAAGSQSEGVRPETRAEETGLVTGDLAAAPDLPEGAELGSAGLASESADDQNGDAAASGSGNDQDGAMDDLAGRLAAQIASVDDAGVLAHFSLRTTPEGLVIEIADLTGDPLFSAGSARPEDVLETLMTILVPVLQRAENAIAITGHTDAAPFNGRDGYSNWDLSAERASAARRVIVAAGLEPERIVRISGQAATDPIVDDPFSPRNRRIAITLLRKDDRS